jgi:hypothetical protein
MAKPATLDGYQGRSTLDFERVLVTLLRGLGPWKNSVYLVGGLTPRYLVRARPPAVPVHAGCSCQGYGSRCCGAKSKDAPIFLVLSLARRVRDVRDMTVLWYGAVAWEGNLRNANHWSIDSFAGNCF